MPPGNSASSGRSLRLYGIVCREIRKREVVPCCIVREMVLLSAVVEVVVVVLGDSAGCPFESTVSSDGGSKFVVPHRRTDCRPAGAGTELGTGAAWGYHLDISPQCLDKSFVVEERIPVAGVKIEGVGTIKEDGVVVGGGNCGVSDFADELVVVVGVFDDAGVDRLPVLLCEHTGDLLNDIPSPDSIVRSPFGEKLLRWIAS